MYMLVCMQMQLQLQYNAVIELNLQVAFVHWFAEANFSVQFRP